MVPGDIAAELATALRAVAVAGELPWPVTELSAAGTWRPAPPGEGGGPGTYATSLPVLIARRISQEPQPQDARAIAARLARALEPVPWIAAARASGPGYLTVTVTTGHLAGLPARIVAAGQRAVPAMPPGPDPAAAPDWQQAWTAQRDALTASLAKAAAWADPDFSAQHRDVGHRRRVADPASGHIAASRRTGPVEEDRDRGPVATAVAWYGADAVIYVLARRARAGQAAIERQLGLPLDLDNPFVLVRYAHAHAASTLRWAAELAESELGETELAPGPEPAQPAPDPESGELAGAELTGAGLAPNPEPAELALIDLLSWFEERLASAARRRRPAELCGYLEQLSAAYLHCAQTCPALLSGGAAAPPDPAGPQAAARLELADASRAVIGAGLRLTGVSRPVRLFGI